MNTKDIVGYQEIPNKAKTVQETNQGLKDHTIPKTKRPEYKVWCNTKINCYSDEPNCYTDKNIQVCKEWKDDFLCFLRDLGKMPSPQHRLLRIDTDKGYFKGNVTWSLKHRLTGELEYLYNNEYKTKKDWYCSLRLTTKRIKLINRRLRTGWDFQDAITYPKFKHKPTKGIDYSDQVLSDY